MTVGPASRNEGRAFRFHRWATHATHGLQIETPDGRQHPQAGTVHLDHGLVRVRLNHSSMNDPQSVDASSIDIFLEPSRPPALLEFWAPWCAPCLAMAPVMRELVHELRNIARVGRVDIEACPGVAERFGVEAAPTLIVFVHGEAAAHVVGFQPSLTLKRWVRQILQMSA